MKNVKKMVYAALLSSLALVLGLIQIPTPFQSYLALDGSEIIVLVSGNFFGFSVMSIVIYLRSILRFVFGLSTGFAIVGEIAAIISSFIFGGVFLLIKKLTNKKENTFKLNLVLVFILILLAIPFSIYAFKGNNLVNSNWLVIGLLTILIPLFTFIIFTLFNKKASIKYSKDILESTTCILSNTLIMTVLNFFFITPSNALQRPALFTTLINEMNMPFNAYFYGFILPLIPFNILKGLISIIIFYLIEKTLEKVINRN